MPDPMTDEERALLEHRWAVRVDLHSQASHAAQVARRLVAAAADAHLDAPAVVVRAVEALEGYAVAVHERVQAERAELQLDDEDGLCELRIKGVSRVWGFRRGNVIHVLWWDPEHTVLPGNR